MLSELSTFPLTKLIMDVPGTAVLCLKNPDHLNNQLISFIFQQANIAVSNNRQQFLLAGFPFQIRQRPVPSSSSGDRLRKRI